MPATMAPAKAKKRGTTKPKAAASDADSQLAARIAIDTAALLERDPLGDEPSGGQTVGHETTPQASAPPENPTPKPTGRPTDFNDDIAAEICERLSGGQSLTAMCAELDHMPGTTTVFQWLHRHAGFREQYARARANWTEAKVEEMEQISQDSAGDFIMTDKGMMFDREHVERSKLKIQTLQWIVARLQPRKWGDKLQLDVTTEVRALTDEQLAARIENQLATAGLRLEEVANDNDADSHEAGAARGDHA